LIIGINGHGENSQIYTHAKTICEKYTNESKAPISLHVYDFPNIKGKPNSLNEMVKYTTGDYIAILDVDDVWLPQKLEKQLHYIYEKYDVIGTKCVYFGDLTNEPFIPTGDLQHIDFTRLNPIINSSALIRKDCAYWHDVWVEDYDMWIRLWKQKKRFFNVDSVLVKHYIHKNSAFNSKHRKTILLKENVEKLENDPNIILFS
jgi:glycosyltransferase involved in cell wall biosynthesis